MSDVPGYRDTPSRPWHPEDPVDAGEAEEFLRMFHAEHPDAGPVEPRLREVRAEIAATGTYVHSGAELTYGAKVAWRNASRCIGRLSGHGLLVLDGRTSTGAEQICHDLVTHRRVAGGTRDGRRIRPVISVFPPAEPGRPYPRVWNEQLIRYAGYREPDGDVVGDPRYLDFTAVVQQLGWQGKGAAFDVLPVVVETPHDGVRLFELPEDAVVEVPLEHPEHEWFAELELRWHAVPAISNMRLSIGGVQYPPAPVNGWDQGTEIRAPKLGDPQRDHLMPPVPAALGLDTSRPRPAWRG